MIFKIVQRNELDPKAGQYGVTPFDAETGESLGDFFGTKIVPTLDGAIAYAQAQIDAIVKVGDEASYEIIG